MTAVFVTPISDTITSLNCEKYSYDGFANNPQNLQSYPC
jgi:hypothetical protein